LNFIIKTMDEQILINYTKNDSTYLLAISGEVKKCVNTEDEKSAEFISKLKQLIEEYYG